VEALIVVRVVSVNWLTSVVRRPLIIAVVRVVSFVSVVSVN